MEDGDYRVHGLRAGAFRLPSDALLILGVGGQGCGVGSVFVRIRKYFSSFVVAVYIPHGGRKNHRVCSMRFKFAESNFYSIPMRGCTWKI